MQPGFILDTCVLSETSKAKPHHIVINFLQKAEHLAVPVPVLMEFQLGITELAARDPVRAVKLANWYQGVISAGLPVLNTTREVAEVWGVLAADRRLRGLVAAQGKRPRVCQDLHVAAFSLVHRLPIATLNIRDFMLIDSCHPLPGVYSPAEQRWHARLEPLSEEEARNECSVVCTL